jgi:hypothetical protein
MCRCAIAVCRKLPTSDSNSERVGWPRRTLTCRLTSRCVNPCRNSLIAGYSALSWTLTSQSTNGPDVSCAHLRKAPSRSCSLPPPSGWPSLSRQTAAAHKSRAEITLRVPRLNAVQSSRSGGAVNSSGDARLPAAHAHLLWGVKPGPRAHRRDHRPGRTAGILIGQAKQDSRRPSRDRSTWRTRRLPGPAGHGASGRSPGRRPARSPTRHPARWWARPAGGSPCGRAGPRW